MHRERGRARDSEGERERERERGGEREREGGRGEGKERETETEMERGSVLQMYTVDLIFNAIMSYLSYYILFMLYSHLYNMGIEQFKVI